jgi:hypothetical protein
LQSLPKLGNVLTFLNKELYTQRLLGNL